MRVARGEATTFLRFRDDMPFSKVWEIYAHQVLYARQQYHSQ